MSEIQFESPLTNQPVTNPNALELPAPTASARNYDVSAASTTAPISTQTNRDSLTFSQKGKLLRLDLVVVSDTDHNGLADAWELRYFGHLGVDPNADPDHDGMSNLREYLAGTDPTNSNSVLKFTGIEKSAPGFTVYWLSATGKTYTVQVATNASGPFSANATGIAATPPENSYLVAETNAPVKFYRVSTP